MKTIDIPLKKNQKIDACISYFGKPYQTIVTIFSLLEHNAEYLDKIYLIVDKNQPYPDAWEGISKIKYLFKKRGLIIYYPDHFLPYIEDHDPAALTESQRKSIRYQFALEATDKPFLLLLHNDILFRDKIIDKLLNTYYESNDSRLVGVGPIGQCWNCPAFSARVCNSLKFPTYIPTQEEAMMLYSTYESPRKERGLRTIYEGRFFPMPECRLNEHLCLINTALYHEATLPKGLAPYFGGLWNGSDTASAWFYNLVHNKYNFKHFYYEPRAIHAPFSSSNNGIGADTKRDIYDSIETQSFQYMKAHYFSEKFKWSTIISGKAFGFWKRLQLKLML